MKKIENILARLHGDDQTVLMELYKDHFNYLAALPFRLLRNVHECQDVVSEAFLEIWNIRHSFESDTHVESILHLKIKNKTIDILRARRHVSTHPDVLDTLEAAPGLGFPSPAGIDRVQLVYTAIAQLPKKLRQVMEMLYADQLKVGEIADILDIPQPTVSARRKKAIKLILDKIEKHDPGLRKTLLTLLFITVLIILLKVF